MSGLVRTLWIIVVAEIVVAGVMLTLRADQPAPPSPTMDRLDTPTARELRELRDRLSFDRAEDWTELGGAYLGYGFFGEAAQCYQQAATMDPTSAEILFGWGYSLERYGRMDDAIAKFQEAAALGDARMATKSWYHVGRNHLRQEQVAQAEAVFARVRDFPPATYHLGKLFLRSGRAAEAITLVEGLAARFPNEPKLAQLLAQAHEQMGNTSRAAEYRDRAEHASDPMGLYDLKAYVVPLRMRRGLSREAAHCSSLHKAGDIEGAAQCYRALLQDHPSWRQRHKVLPIVARLELELDRPEEALRLLELFYDDNPGEPESLELAGDALHRLGRDEEARQAWERAVRIRSSPRLHRSLSDFHETQGDGTRAARHHALSLRDAGIESMQHDDVGRAVTDLLGAVRADPRLPRAWFHLGEAYRRHGRVESADDAYRRCLEIDPDHGRAAARLAE